MRATLELSEWFKQRATYEALTKVTAAVPYGIVNYSTERCMAAGSLTAGFVSQSSVFSTLGRSYYYYFDTTLDHIEGTLRVARRSEATDTEVTLAANNRINSLL